ncbi:MAG: hypothetical protein IT465_07550 [Moraxellaceae bacterium]|jgi:ribonuclease T2|nr:hypothetical protein [Moraxellaceae bacterium]
MRICQPVFGIVAFWAGLISSQIAYAEEKTSAPHPYYLLSINLAPAACVVNPEHSQLRQCQEGYAVIVRGLWKEKPEAKSGSCSEKAPELSPIQQRVLEKIMPDEEMRNKAWQRYGACTGLSAQEYFRAVMSYANKLKLPALFTQEAPSDREFEQAFLAQEVQKLNNDLPEKGFYFRCQTHNDKTFLTEVRVCYDKLGQFVSCKKFQPNCPNLITLRSVK